MMSVLDQLIKTSRVTRTNDNVSTFRSTSTIKKLKKITTRLKRIVEKKKTHREKNNTWATIARWKIAIIKFDIDAKKTSILSSKRELKIAIKRSNKRKFKWHKEWHRERLWERHETSRRSKVREKIYWLHDVTLKKSSCSRSTMKNHAKHWKTMKTERKTFVKERIWSVKSTSLYYMKYAWRAFSIKARNERRKQSKRWKEWTRHFTRVWR